jgi:hypothetical protein
MSSKNDYYLDEDGDFVFKVANRHNTRRWRRRNKIRFFNLRNVASMRITSGISESELNANWIRCGAHLADQIARGITLKTYSAWSGCKVRVLSKLLDNYIHRRLPGQREVTL